MNQFPNAGDGLKKMFIASLGAIICGVCAIIPLINLIAALAAIVFLVISLIGLNNLGKDIEDCKKAFILTIVQIVVSFLASLLAKVVVVGALLSIAESIIALLVVYFVCIPVSKVLSQIGATDAASLGETAWKLNLVCYAVAIVAGILSMISALAGVVLVISIVVLIVGLVGQIIYMIFLYKSYTAFGA